MYFMAKMFEIKPFDGKIFLSNVAIGIETSYSDTKSRFRHSKCIAGVFRKVYLRSSFYCKLIKSFMPISFYVAIIRNNSSVYLLIQ